MEWGTFITVIIAVYLAWFGLNFLYDLFFSGKQKLEVEGGIQYNMSALMGEEEKPQVISQKDFEPKPVDVHKTEEPSSKAPVVSDTPAESGSGQSIKTSPTLVESAPQNSGNDNDWAAAIDQEVSLDGPEETIAVPVQGQPVSVSEYLQSLKDQAKAETSSITF